MANTETMLSDYRSGLTMAAIGEKHGISTQAVSARLRKCDLRGTRANRPPLPPSPRKPRKPRSGPTVLQAHRQKVRDEGEAWAAKYAADQERLRSTG